MPSTCIRSVTAARSMAFSVPKWMQQRAFARRSDAGDLLQAGLAHVARATRPVRADGETMGLIAQPLDEIEHRVARRQLE